MNGTDIELRRELWAWRALTLLAILIFTVSNVATFLIDRDQHSKDNIERQKNWQIIQSNQRQIVGMVGKNFDQLIRNDEHLRQCVNCHSYPQIKFK